MDIQTAKKTIGKFLTLALAVVFIIVLTVSLLPFIPILVTRIQFASAPTLDELKISSEIVNATLVAFGAFGAGIGGLSVVREWIYRKESRRERIYRYRRLYPISKLNEDFRIVHSPKFGTIYIQDTSRKMIHHVSNPATLEALYLFNEAYNTSPEILETINIPGYKQGEPINTELDAE